MWVPIQLELDLDPKWWIALKCGRGLSKNLVHRLFSLALLQNAEDLFPERYLRWADCVLMVFSITSKSSFCGLSEYLDMWQGFGAQHRSRRASHDAQVGGNISKDFRRAVTPTLSMSVAKAPTVILVAAKSDLESARSVLTKPKVSKILRQLRKVGQFGHTCWNCSRLLAPNHAKVQKIWSMRLSGTKIFRKLINRSFVWVCLLVLVWLNYSYQEFKRLFAIWRKRQCNASSE